MLLTMLTGVIIVIVTLLLRLLHIHSQSGIFFLIGFVAPQYLGEVVQELSLPLILKVSKRLLPSIFGV
jgi:hypothetical protein